MSVVEDHPQVSDPPPPEIQVLIEEARRRQRLRRTALAGTVAALGIAGAIFGLTSGGGPPSTNGPAAHRDPARAPSAARLHELTASGGYLKPGTYITGLVSYRGELMAAGYVERVWNGRPAAECSPCRPVVWVSRTGARWREAYTPEVARGGAKAVLGGAEADLVPLNRSLLLVSQAGGAVDAWRSTNGRAWHAVKLPAALASGPVIDGPLSDGTRVLIEDRMRSGRVVTSRRTRPRVQLWITTDGVHWRRAAGPAGARSFDVSRTGTGFAAIGAAKGAINTSFWRSRDGVSWTRVPIRSRAQRKRLLTMFAAPLLFSVPIESIADVSGRRLAALGKRERVLLRLTGSQTRSFEFAGAHVVGDTLLVAERARHAVGGVPAGAITFWRLGLGHA